MDDKTKLKTGIIGTVIAAICCFTPFLVVVLGAVGLSAWLGWLDYLLFPILFSALGFTTHAIYRLSGNQGVSPTAVIVPAVILLSGLLFWLEFQYAVRITIGVIAAVAVYAFFLRRRDPDITEEST